MLAWFFFQLMISSNSFDFILHSLLRTIGHQLSFKKHKFSLVFMFFRFAIVDATLISRDNQFLSRMRSFIHHFAFFKSTFHNYVF
jgi:hypothetical protein